MNLSQKETYFVAVKVLLEKDGKLFIFKDRFGDWDLPGGRIRKDEFENPLDEVIRRKMKEELGDSVQYTIDRPIVFFRHERKEATEGNMTVRIFGVGYAGKFLGGEIKLSADHTQMEWVDIKTFKPEDYFTGGWLKGLQEYLVLVR